MVFRSNAMLRLLCCLFLLYVPSTQPVSVLIDGSIDVSQNWNFEFTPVGIIRALNVSMAPEVAAILAGITRPTTTELNHAERRGHLLLINEPTESSQRPTRKKYKKKKTTEALGAGAEIRAMIESLKAITTYAPEIDLESLMLEKENAHETEKTETIKKKIKTRNLKKVPHRHTVDINEVITKKSGIKDVTRKKIKKKKRKHHKKTTPQMIDGQRFLNVLERIGLIKTVKYNKSKFGNPTMRMSTPRMQTLFDYQPAYNGPTFSYDPIDHDRKLNLRIHLVKNDVRLQNFTLQIFKQSIGVFEAIKSKVNNTKVRNKVDFIARSYNTKFSNFVQANQNQKIITRLGTQKVILNTIETSNRIMRRLINFLIGDMEKKGVLRDNEGLAVVWRNHVENEEQQEYVQACQKFNICRSKYSLSNFMADYFTVLLQVDDQKLKQGLDALTEVLKDTNFSTVLDKKMQTRFNSNIAFIERAEPQFIRPVLWMFRNMLVNKNQPLVIEEKVPKKVINQSVALMDVIDILDEKIPATEENLLEWNDLRNSLVQWANNQRTDILEIMQAFVSMIMRKGINKLDSNTTRTFHDKFKLFLRATA